MNLEMAMYPQDYWSKTEVVVIPKHVQVGTIELVNVPLEVVANTSAGPFQSDPKLDEFLWHVVEESEA